MTRLGLQNCIVHVKIAKIQFTTQVMCNLLTTAMLKVYQKKTTGASRVEAKLNAAWASPSLAVPSPK